ncbi:MAG: hypothetical protein MHPSP_002702, partial [Paramarteilia canceri]
ASNSSVKKLTNPYNIGIKNNIKQTFNAANSDGIVFPTSGGNLNLKAFSKIGREWDDYICDSIVNNNDNILITKAKYDGSFWGAPNQIPFTTRLRYPGLYDTVLNFEQGEPIFLFNKKLSKSVWQKGIKLVQFETGTGYIEGYFPLKLVKSGNGSE